MNIVSCSPVAVKEVIQCSEIASPFMRLLEVIQEYGIYFFSLIVSILSFAPFGYKLNLSGPKKIISVNLSVSLKRLAKMLPFESWTPSIKVSVSCKFKKKKE